MARRAARADPQPLFKIPRSRRAATLSTSWSSLRGGSAISPISPRERYDRSCASPPFSPWHPNGDPDGPRGDAAGGAGVFGSPLWPRLASLAGVDRVAKPPCHPRRHDRLLGRRASAPFSPFAPEADWLCQLGGRHAASDLADRHPTPVKRPPPLADKEWRAAKGSAPEWGTCS